MRDDDTGETQAEHECVSLKAIVFEYNLRSYYYRAGITHCP